MTGTGWRLERAQMKQLAAAVEKLGTAHPAVVALDWPLESRKRLLGEPYWLVKFDQMVALGRALR